jgi:hypothetical protein
MSDREFRIAFALVVASVGLALLLSAVNAAIDLWRFVSG